jgi:enoyl-CoA hydratase/carnithine racemase
MISVPIFRRASASRLASAFLTGEPFDAAAARDAGLVTHVADDVAATVGMLCDGVAMGAPGAVAATKQLLVRAFDRDVAARDAELARVQLVSDELFAGAEAAEGMAAFADQRTPMWQHQRTD